MRKNIDFKNLVAILVIISSFAIAFGLAVISNQRSSYWVAIRDLTPGHIVDSQDFVAKKGAFARESNGYIFATQSPIGYSIAKFVAAGEYLHESALAEGTGESSVKLLSFAVSAPDLPSVIRIGDLVNLYQVINDNGDGNDFPSQLVIESVYVVDLNRKGENLGGSSIVTLAIPDDFVERVLDATRKGRMVVVANHG